MHARESTHGLPTTSLLTGQCQGRVRKQRGHCPRSGGQTMVDEYVGDCGGFRRAQCSPIAPTVRKLLCRCSASVLEATLYFSVSSGLLHCKIVYIPSTYPIQMAHGPIFLWNRMILDDLLSPSQRSSLSLCFFPSTLIRSSHPHRLIWCREPAHTSALLLTVARPQ